jgi:YHS domain-containing protein
MREGTLDRIDAEIAAAKNRIEEMRQEASDEFKELGERYERLAELSKKLTEDPRSGHLKKLEERFDNATLELTQDRSGYHGTLKLKHTPQYPATVKLTVALTHDGLVQDVTLSYDVEILPVFIDYRRHDEITFPLDDFDEDAAFDWVDERILEFVRTYMELQYAERYQRNNLVTDPVLDRRFSKLHAAAEKEHGGHTFYFLTAESLAVFESDPDRFVRT